ncbi:hypothetical protein M501DRAFT_1017387 [Patellaria atrata CBS 101060]|uniref:Transglutaminase-like domain-containing protein n=1 Tax=Patellaria atrata CBS 101060 TaxID=1346257 RepID=A0A9P4S964_9PEZI|nr:hypothetical protein M501DRAFT_1017387 [Patellaria atrata CBS 101060]
MAESEPPLGSVKGRIAAMNLDHIARTPASPSSYGQAIATKQAPAKPPPQLPRRPAVAPRTQTINNPPIRTNGISSAVPIGNQPTTSSNQGVNPTPSKTVENRLPPPLPARPARTPHRQPPPLPARTPSEQSTTRRSSVESTSSTISARSFGSALSSRTSMSNPSHTPAGEGNYRVKAPPYDPETLPFKVPTKPTTDQSSSSRVPLKQTVSSPSMVSKKLSTPSLRSSTTLSSIPPLPCRTDSTSTEQKPVSTTRSPSIPSLKGRSPLTLGFNNPVPAPVPQSRPILVPGSQEFDSDGPPPIPLSSRPNLAALNASKPKISTNSCLKCRDFSGPDNHAARYPRESIPTHDIAWLANELTSPFPSQTDKARVLFTWLHHNIAYNTRDFFAGCVKKMTPAETMASGLAVCEGYASLFTALASKVGMESMVVSGYGKGYSHKRNNGSTIPPFKSNHAWNAVRIDNGEWKLIDACWGAGAVNGPNVPYHKRFAPECFTMNNIEFGIKHFPTDRAHFFRNDNQISTWEEFYSGGPDADAGLPTVYSGCQSEHGFAEQSFQPSSKRIRVHDQSGPSVVRFQWENICKHWKNEKHGKGKPYVFIIKVGGLDGRKTEYHPVGTDGYFWWVDIPRAELGCPGQTVSLYSVQKIDGKDARGFSVEEYLQKKGRYGMSFGGVAAWELI